MLPIGPVVCLANMAFSLDYEKFVKVKVLLEVLTKKDKWLSNTVTVKRRFYCNVFLSPQGRKKAVKDLTDLTFLRREELSENNVHNEFVISQVCPRMRKGNVFMCPYVCLSVRVKTFECLDIETSFCGMKVHLDHI